MTLLVSGYPGEVDEVAFSKMMRGGAFYNTVQGLSLTPSGSNRGVEVDFDFAVAPGILVEIDAPTVLNANENATGGIRRDRIILKHDWSINTTTLEIKHGAAGGSLPDVTRNPGVLWEQVLGTLETANGQGAYASGDIQPYNWLPNAIMVLPNDGTPRPFSADGIITIERSGDNLMYSDGLEYRRLRSRQEDSDRRILKRKAGGAGTLAVNAQGFYNANNSNVYSILQDGDPAWSDSGVGHSAQYRCPKTGLWRVSCACRFARTNSGQTGRVHLRFKSGMASNVATSGTTRILTTIPFPIDSTAPVTIQLFDLVDITAGSICGFILENASSHTIDYDDDGTGTYFSVEYAGPTT